MKPMAELRAVHSVVAVDFQKRKGIYSCPRVFSRLLVRFRLIAWSHGVAALAAVALAAGRLFKGPLTHSDFTQKLLRLHLRGFVIP